MCTLIHVCLCVCVLMCPHIHVCLHVCTVFVLTCMCSCMCVIIHVSDIASKLGCGLWIFLSCLSDFHIEPAASFMDIV